MRHTSNIAGILIASALLCAVATGDMRAAEIQFKPRATVSSGVVTLRDVAQVLDADPATVEKLEKIVLGPAPAVGGQARLEFADIRSRLQATGVNLAETAFSGANVVQLSSGGDHSAQSGSVVTNQVLRSQRERVEKLLVETVRRHLTAQDQNLGGVAIDVQIGDKDVPRLFAALSGGECQIGGVDPKLTDYQLVVVRYRDRRGKPGEERVSCRISPQPQILVVRYTIPPGHILREADLVWRQSERVEGALTKLEDAIHRETRRTIRQDEPVRAADVRAVPLVRNNDIVTAVSRRGGVTVKAEMKSRSEGSLGETVTLVSLKRGQDLVLARVTGLHEAEVITADGKASDTLQDATGRIEFRGGHK